MFRYGIVPEPNIDPLYMLIGKDNINTVNYIGFRRIQIVKPNMVKFFAEANLGLSDPNDPNSVPLNKMLSVGVNGVTSPSMLTELFVI